MTCPVKVSPRGRSQRETGRIMLPELAAAAAAATSHNRLGETKGARIGVESEMLDSSEGVMWEFVYEQ